MRLVFAGTPGPAVASLDALLKSRHSVAAVVTRPDAKAGRGLSVGRSPVAERAAAAGVEVLQPARPSDPDFLARLREIGPDCCAVTAYGALLPQAALDIPMHGWVNLHFSVLPAWRGAAPVQRAILHGDDITGATTFGIVRELDAGPVYGVLTEAVLPSDTAGDLLGRLSTAGAELLVATLDGIETGELEARPQPADGVSLAPKLGTADAQVHWQQPAVSVDRLIRACTPAPGAWTQLDGHRIKLGPVSVSTGLASTGLASTGLASTGPASTGPASTGPASTGPASTGPASTGPASSGPASTGPAGTAPPGTERPATLAPGELWLQRDMVLAGTATTPVQLGEVQPDGKRRMPAADWIRGLRLDGRVAVLG